MFWAYRELSGGNNTYDRELENFIRVILSNQYAISNKKGDTLDFLLGAQPGRKLDDYTDNISFYKYNELGAITEQSVLFLIDAFDCFANGNDKIKTYLKDNYKPYFIENDTFEEALNHKFESNQKRILFHAYVRFLIVNKNDRSGIRQWLRVISSLANNTIIDGTEEISNVINSIENLLPQSNDILKYLIENVEINFFSDWQVLEEKIKAHLIIKGGQWKEKIENAEKLDCFYAGIRRNS